MGAKGGYHVCNPLKKYCPNSGFKKMIKSCEYTCGICQKKNRGETMRQSNLEKSSLRSNTSMDLDDRKSKSPFNNGPSNI